MLYKAIPGDLEEQGSRICQDDQSQEQRHADLAARLSQRKERERWNDQQNEEGQIKSSRVGSDALKYLFHEINTATKVIKLISSSRMQITGSNFRMISPSLPSMPAVLAPTITLVGAATEPRAPPVV